MSDKPKKDEKKADDAHGGAKKKGAIGALLTKLPVLLGGVMVVEAVLLLGAVKMLGGGPAPAEGAELHAKAGHGADAHGEEDDDDASHAGADAGGGHGDAKDAGPKINPKGKYALPVLEFKATNKVSGRMFLFDVQIEAQVLGANVEKVKSRLEKRKALISDRVRTIIAQSDPEKLNGQAEPGLETLKRQIKYELDEPGVIGPGLIDLILVPRCIPFRADF